MQGGSDTNFQRYLLAHSYTKLHYLICPFTSMLVAFKGDATTLLSCRPTSQRVQCSLKIFFRETAQHMKTTIVVIGLLSAALNQSEWDGLVVYFSYFLFYLCSYIVDVAVFARESSIAVVNYCLSC